MSTAVQAGRPSLSLVVPLFNEEDRFGEHAEALAKFVSTFAPGSELILVDDGSTDRTAEMVEEFLRRSPLPVSLLRRPHEGKGGAVRAGLSAATAEYLGFCDVDLSTPLDQLEVVLDTAVSSRALAIGSRDVAASRLVKPQGRVRETLGKTYNRLIQLTVAPGISDTQCGAKVAARGLWEAILPHCREVGFAWDVEAVAVARRLGIVVREVAVEWSHDERTRVRLLRDGSAMVAAIPRILRSVGKVPVDSRSRGAASGVFDHSLASTLMESDTQHWWFRSKGAFVSSVLRRHAGRGAEAALLLDVGAGAGGVTAILGWPPGRAIAVDGSEVLARAARSRHGLPAVTGSIGRLPLLDRSVDVVTLLDVIEHLERPEVALDDAWRVLGPGGCLIVTVPAHPWLWSRADELLGHVRRYTRPLLREQVEASGFRLVSISHVFSWLVVPVWLQRRLASDDGGQLGLDRTSAVVDRLALVLTRLERAVTRRVNLGLGTSIICLAVKESGPDGHSR